MRRSLLALSLAALLASPAAAQITPYPAGPTNQSSLALIAPTPPTAANNNQIATTAWVNNLVTAGLPLASGKIWIGSVGNVATAQTPSGDLTVSNAGVFTFGTVNANVGTFGSATLCTTITVNAKGLITAASAATCAPAVGSITGLGTGVATALGVNVGSAGAFVTFNGAGGTPSSMVGTNITGVPIATGVSGLSAGCATALTTPTSANLRTCFTDESGTGLIYFQSGDLGTPTAGNLSNLTFPVANITGFAAGGATFLGTPSSANLRAFLTDESGTGLAYFQGGDIGTPSAGVGSNLTALNATQLTTGTLPPARLGLSQITNSIGANVALNNTGTYFDGPSIAQGSTGTWWASGTVTVVDTTGVAIIDCKLWDGTTVIASTHIHTTAVNLHAAIALSGFIATPAGNIRISCKDTTNTTGVMVFNGSGNSKDGTVSAFRIN